MTLISSTQKAVQRQDKLLSVGFRTEIGPRASKYYNWINQAEQSGLECMSLPGEQLLSVIAILCV